MGRDIEPPRLWAYVLIALAGLITGMALGQLGAERDARGPRIEWPAPKLPQPRSLGP